MCAVCLVIVGLLFCRWCSTYEGVQLTIPFVATKPMHQKPTQMIAAPAYRSCIESPQPRGRPRLFLGRTLRARPTKTDQRGCAHHVQGHVTGCLARMVNGRKKSKVLVYLVVGQSVLKRIFNQAGHIFYIQFTDKVFAVRFNGVGAYKKLLRNFVGGKFFHNQLQHLGFPRR